MGNLKQAAKRLSEQITDYLQQKQTVLVCFQVKINNVDLLAWLKSQTAYPQFYLNFRDKTKILAASGKVRTFSDLDAAQEFIEQYDYPLVGGLQFQGYGQFVLPQFLLLQSENSTALNCFIEGADSASTALAALKTLSNTTPLSPLPKQIPLCTEQRAGRQTWCDWVNQALFEIRQGKLSKLVLANETRLHLKQSINAYDFLAESEKYNQGCYHFLWTENPNSQFVGSTPERLFVREYNLFLTEALAGTAPVSDDPQENQRQADWLLRDEKNRNENWLVVQDIAQNLRDLTETFEVGELELKPLRKVQHLLRKIRADLAAHYQDAALLNAIHPTAAVSGLPQQQAKMILSKIETFERGWYAGTFGVMSKTDAEFCVAIRSAFIESHRIRVFAGAGIVEGSQPLEEWQEIERKAAGLISLFAKNQ